MPCEGAACLLVKELIVFVKRQCGYGVCCGSSGRGYIGTDSPESFSSFIDLGARFVRIEFTHSPNKLTLKGEEMEATDMTLVPQVGFVASPCVSY